MSHSTGIGLFELDIKHNVIPNPYAVIIFAGHCKLSVHRLIVVTTAVKLQMNTKSSSFDFDPQTLRLLDLFTYFRIKLACCVWLRHERFCQSRLTWRDHTDAS